MTRIHRPQLHLFYPFALGLAGAVATLVAGGLNWTPGILALVLILSGGGLGLQLATTRQRIVLQSIKDYLAGQQQFGAPVAPVWSGHIESSREQMESAISALSKRFSGIVDKLVVAVQTSSFENFAIDHKKKAGLCRASDSRCAS